MRLAVEGGEIDGFCMTVEGLTNATFRDLVDGPNAPSIPIVVLNAEALELPFLASAPVAERLAPTEEARAPPRRRRARPDLAALCRGPGRAGRAAGGAAPGARADVRRPGVPGRGDALFADSQSGGGTRRQPAGGGPAEHVAGNAGPAERRPSVAREPGAPRAPPPSDLRPRLLTYTNPPSSWRARRRERQPVAPTAPRSRRVGITPPPDSGGGCHGQAHDAAGGRGHALRLRGIADDALGVLAGVDGGDRSPQQVAELDHAAVGAGQVLQAMYCYLPLPLHGFLVVGKALRVLVALVGPVQRPQVLA